MQDAMVSKILKNGLFWTPWDNWLIAIEEGAFTEAAGAAAALSPPKALTMRLSPFSGTVELGPRGTSGLKCERQRGIR